MRSTTLCLLLKDDRVLLAMKKRGFGAGRWNGVGGKVQEGETIEAAALREMEEEIGVRAKEGALEKAAFLTFYFKTKPEWDQEVTVFVLREWEGEPSESEEMKPAWYAFDQVPYAEMWPDDKDWLPIVLDKRKVKADFHFADLGDVFEKVELAEVAGF
jgi:8-oxo-dGTP diphosphatase / 2-hydroxy-dATP diphosphatase